MPQKVKKKVEKTESVTLASSLVQWLRADYHFHVFHYRMPETVAIAAVTPFVPSPLTMKMALVASLLQSGDNKSAKQLARLLPSIKVDVVPSPSAFSFKTFLRYRSMPAVESNGGLDESGSYCPSRPHMREYALLEDCITVFIGLPDRSIVEIVKMALQGIRYLGAKDSLVTCLCVKEVSGDEVKKAKTIRPLQEGVPGSVILGADFNSSVSLELRDLIPGLRKKEHYRLLPFTLSGKVIVKGGTRIFKRN